jgi:transcriptional regulator with PAS, ATPase and Fis domain
MNEPRRAKRIRRMKMVSHTESNLHLLQNAPWVAAFSNASAIGLGIVNSQLRYCSVNNALAEINGIIAHEHYGATMREILGDGATQAEPAMRRVFATGRCAWDVDFTAQLAGRGEPGSWIRHCFPIKDNRGRVQQVGALVVEVTAQKNLDDFFSQIFHDLLGPKSKQTLWVAHELHNAVQEYHMALAISLGRLASRRWAKRTQKELLAKVEQLDQSVISMDRLASAVAERFPIVNHC